MVPSSKARRIATLVAVVLLTGCARSGARSVIGPDGTSMLHVHCEQDQGRCYQLAGHFCPAGYQIFPTPGGGGANFLIRCRSGSSNQQASVGYWESASEAPPAAQPTSQVAPPAFLPPPPPPAPPKPPEAPTLAPGEAAPSAPSTQQGVRRFDPVPGVPAAPRETPPVPTPVATAAKPFNSASPPADELDLGY